jgi:hypothetical protein
MKWRSREWPAPPGVLLENNFQGHRLGEENPIARQVVRKADRRSLNGLNSPLYMIPASCFQHIKKRLNNLYKSGPREIRLASRKVPESLALSAVFTVSQASMKLWP